jgi:apolipoprotein N-acyltransferase
MAAQSAPIWKRVLAPILDFFTAFFGFGMAISWITGSVTSGGDFELTGAPALVLFALVIAYFFVGRRFAGGTIWDRILGIGRPQPRT